MHEYQPPEMRLTPWTNPTKNDVVVLLFVGATARNPSGRMRVTIKPGESVEIDSKYDDAIQKVRGGKVISGLAPQLMKGKGPRPPLDPALDVEAMERRAARDKVRDAAALKATAEGMLAEAATAAASVAEPTKAPEPKPAEPERQQGGQGQGQRRDGK